MPYTQQSNPYTGEWMSFDTPQQYQSWVQTLQTPPTTGPGGTPGGQGDAWAPDQAGYNAYMGGLAQQPNQFSGLMAPQYPSGPPANIPINAPGMPSGMFQVNPMTGQLVVGGVGNPAAGQTPPSNLTGTGQNYTPQGELSRTGFAMSLVPGMSQPTPAPLLDTFLGKFVDAMKGGAVTNLITGGQSSVAQEQQNLRDWAASWAQLNPELAAGIDWKAYADKVAADYGQWAQTAMYNGKPLSSYQGPPAVSTYPGQGQPWFPGATYDPSSGALGPLLWSGGPQRSMLTPEQMGAAYQNLPPTSAWGGASGAPASPAAAAGQPEPANLNDINTFIYQPGASGPAGTPGVSSKSPTEGTMSKGPAGNNNPASPSNNAGSGTPDQTLAYNSADINYLRDLLARNGIPIDQLPAWQAMIDAQQRNINRGQADLAEQFNVSGNRFSNTFGTASADYQNQARLNQNALLAQMLTGSQENAANRVLGASNTLAQLGYGGLQQLSNQDFQARMAAQQQQLQAALAMLGSGSSAAQLMAQLGASGASQLNNSAVQAALGMYGTENQAALAQVMRELQLQQMGLGAATNLSQLWQSNLGLGSQLGGQNYGILQDQLNRSYQEWLRTQPQYNSLLPLLMQGANMYPQMFYPQYQPSNLGSILGGIGGLAGSIPGIVNTIGNLINGTNGSSGAGSFWNSIMNNVSGGPPIFGGASNNPFIWF